MTLTYDQLRTELVARLSERSGQDSRAAVRDAKILLSAVSDVCEASLLFAGEDAVPLTVAKKAYALCARCVAGEPIYRAIGKREFHGIDFTLSEHTLEPRDDTEALIELALDYVTDESASLIFADLGTGPGTVALTLLSEMPNATCVATDLEQGALETAKHNAQVNGFEGRIEFASGSWFEALNDREKQLFDFIVSNPPYIASKVVDGLEGNVLDHDPRLALDGGTDGLTAYREIFNGAADHIKPNGFLAVEIGYDQAAEVSRLGVDFGWTCKEMRKDLSGNDRALLFVVEVEV